MHNLAKIYCYCKFKNFSVEKPLGRHIWKGTSVQYKYRYKDSTCIGRQVIMLSLPDFDCVCGLHAHHCYSADPERSTVAVLSLSSVGDLLPSARLSPPATIISSHTLDRWYYTYHPLTNNNNICSILHRIQNGH